ncbi:MAG: hypothetical protein ABIP21_04705 [Acidimicrobiia bacterium]
MRSPLIAIGLVAVAGIAGCSSDAGTKASAKAHPATKAAAKGGATTSTTQPFVSNSKNTPGTLANFVGAKDDVHDTTCKQDGAGWNAGGMVTNSTAAAVKYRIYVSFLNGDTTVGLAEVNVGKVDPKQTTKWTQTVKVDGRDLRCILRVERADI